MTQLMAGKRGLIMGVANDRSIAWGIARVLAGQGAKVATKVLEWRQLSKLKSTYTDALPTYINAKTGRVHTSYAMASTTTGRFGAWPC